MIRSFLTNAGQFIVFPFRSDPPVPVELRGLFKRYYLDIAWWGLLNGSVLAFLLIYAARLGASSTQIGLIGAAPAIINLLFTFPAGSWLKRQKIDRAVFWTALSQRAFYFLLILLPLFFLAKSQIWIIIMMTLVMSVPAVPLAIGFNTLFGEAVPSEWRGYVAGIRNVLLAISTIISTLISGQILEYVIFPLGYQIVFGLGCFGALMSTVQLWFIKPAHRETENNNVNLSALKPEEPTGVKVARLQRSTRANQILRLDILFSPYGKVILLFLLFHTFQYLAIPLFSVYSVNTLKLTDQIISVGTGMFYLSMLGGSIFGSRVSYKFTNHKTTAVGVMVLGLYPVLLIISKYPAIYYLTNVVGGFAWALISVSYLNYLLERTPEDDRPAHLAWYNLIFNAAILIGSLGGPLIAGWIGMPAALLVFAAGRILSGVSIFRWG